MKSKIVLIALLLGIYSCTFGQDGIYLTVDSIEWRNSGSFEGEINILALDTPIDTFEIIEKDLIDYQITNDTLYIYRKWFIDYNPNGFNCLVYNCHDDHIIEYRERLVFAIVKGKIKLIRVDEGKKEKETYFIEKEKTIWKYE